MKMRTDYVTNSSSYSSAEIVIDNPVLLEILQKYKDMGTFGEGEDDLDFSIGEMFNGNVPQLFHLDTPDQFTKTPAIHLLDVRNTSGCPLSIEGSLSLILDFLDSDRTRSFDYEMDLFNLMVEEIIKEKEQIIKGFISIYCSSYGNSDENADDYDGDIYCHEDFKYERNGNEEYYFEKDGHGDGTYERKVIHRINRDKVE